MAVVHQGQQNHEFAVKLQRSSARFKGVCRIGLVTGVTTRSSASHRSCRTPVLGLEYRTSPSVSNRVGGPTINPDYNMVVALSTGKTRRTFERTFDVYSSPIDLK